MNTAKVVLAMVIAAALCVSGSGPGVEATGLTGQIAGKVSNAKTGAPIAYAHVVVIGTNVGAMTMQDGAYRITSVPVGSYTVKAMMMGFKSIEKTGVVVQRDKVTEVMFALEETIVMKTEEIVVGAQFCIVDVTTSGVRQGVSATQPGRDAFHETFRQCMPWWPCGPESFRWPREPWNTESYAFIVENEFRDALDHPFSTFSVDVDAASYSNVRRFVESGELPPADAVRIEEFINYFTYDYPDPKGDDPFSITTEAVSCPWNADHRLVRVGLQGVRANLENLPPSNLVFLCDVSGSMRPSNKLPLLKNSFALLVDKLRAEDRVAIVVYAGSAGLVLPSTPGDQKETIHAALARLEAGGSTAGGAGIKLAYQVAEDNFIKDGNNRVILATDGDFNVGASSDAEMGRLIEEKRESGVFLTMLGFGEANLKDSKMETIADKGNGNYFYIDSIFEGRRVFVGGLASNLFTIAKDVKIQVEFNPAKVKTYRLIGYENRILNKEDFDDDKKDAGEIGAGHSVTALYEIVPAGGDPIAQRRATYTRVSIEPQAYDSPEILTVRFRYKKPDGDKSRLIVRTLTDANARFEEAAVDLRFAVAVAEFGMLLRESKFKAGSSYAHVLETARSSLGEDHGGYRHEFVRLVEKCREITGK